MSRELKTVLVLGGGDSAERDVSLESARGMAGAAKDLGYKVMAADPARPEVGPTEDTAEMFGGAAINETPPEASGDVSGARLAYVQTIAGYESLGIDVVLNGLHGGAGENGTIQAVLDYVGVPYTGSGAAACALAMDKHRSKLLVGAVGVPVAAEKFFRRGGPDRETIIRTVQEGLEYPVVVKPNTQGSSVGLTVVSVPQDMDEALEKAFGLDDHVIVEEYIAGTEITVAVLEGEGALPVLEIRPRSGLYDYFHKYQSGASEYLCPAPVDAALAAAIGEAAEKAFEVLGCRVYGRVDFRLGNDGRFRFLEMNTLPGMTALSLVPKAARAKGIDYGELVSRILHLSLAK